MMAAVATAAMTLGELFGSAAGDLGAVEVRDLVLDSRQVEPGAAFLAVSGETNHGLDFAADALARGASAIVFEPSADHGEISGPAFAVENLKAGLGEFARTFYGRGMEPLSLAGVTGTNGKSTVAHLVAEAQTRRGLPCGYVGTVGSGIPPEISAQALTTPDCLTLHRTLRSLDVRYAAMEVSSHALAQDRVAGLEFGTAAFTNLSHDHLDYHGTLDAYRDAKTRLFRMPELNHAVLFADDPVSTEIARELDTSVRQIDVSLERDSDISARILRSDLQGIELEVLSDGASGKISSPLIGDFNAANLLVALGVLNAWDVELLDACDALSRCAGLPGRMQLLGGDNFPSVVVDYAHTPDALARVLSTLRDIDDGEIWCVFGCGGQRDTMKRPAMGAAASAFADHVVLTDDNPRDEDPGAIVADIRGGLVSHPDVWVEHDRRRAIADAITRAKAGDIVVVAGKGHEESQSIAGEVRSFNDATVVAEVLGGL
ncbi:MAG: UDP-N-acetylmuramoyl-L-alanyl-D-glutamate--2,6-diaminopimelate ligase [Gammaproteobacteria bacterium]